MPRLPRLTARQITTALEKVGFSLSRHCALSCLKDPSSKGFEKHFAGRRYRTRGSRRPAVSHTWSTQIPLACAPGGVSTPKTRTEMRWECWPRYNGGAESDRRG